MTSKVKNLCDKIEGFMKYFHENAHDLLYEKTMLELLNSNFSGIFIKIDNLPLFRIRINEDKNEPFYKTKEIHYAPIKYVCNYGRVNKPGQSMFYCSEFTPICELELLHDYLLKNDVGQERYATYTEWEIQKELNLLILAIAPKHREFINGFRIRNDCFKFVKSEPTAKQESYSNMYNLTSNFFLKNAKGVNAEDDKSVYVVCSAIANYFTLQFPNIDGFIYPSVQGNTGYNIVLRPHVLDNKMILPKNELTMKKWKVSNKNSMNIDPYFHKTGHIHGDSIKWGKLEE